MGVRLCYFGFTGASSQSSGCGDEGGPVFRFAHSPSGFSASEWLGSIESTYA